MAVLSLVVKLKLYIKQIRQRKTEANPLWLDAVEEFTPRQQKVVALQGKLGDTKKVVLLRNACLPYQKGLASEQAITLVWVNVGLAVCEDIPMLILTLLYITKLDQKPDLMMLISMMMSAGMVCML